MIYSTRVAKADGQEITEYRGLHNDIKPYENLNLGDIFYELDRDFVFKWNGTTWVRLVEGDSEGGGNEQFVVNVTMTYNDGQYVVNSADKTSEQLASAVESEKTVMLKGTTLNGSEIAGYTFVPLMSYNPSIKTFVFSTSQAATNSVGQIISIFCDSGEESDIWEVETLTISH